MMQKLLSAIIFIIVSLILYWILKEAKDMKVPPDPWKKKNIRKDKKNLGVCVNCLTPIKDMKQHYCPKCGNVTGEHTRYMPYENIKFNYSIFETIIRKFRRHK